MVGRSGESDESDENQYDIEMNPVTENCLQFESVDNEDFCWVQFIIFDPAAVCLIL